MRVITLYNPKGGSGKSTLAANLAGTLALARHHKVLLIDGDPQKTLSQAFGIAHAAPGGYRELMTHTPSLGLPSPEEIVSKTDVHGVDIVQANLDIDELKSLLESSQEGHLRLRILLEAFRAAHPGAYDYVVIDSTGTQGTISYACAVAADLIVCPIIPDRVSVDAFFRGSAQLIQDMSSNPWAPYRDTPMTAVIMRMRNTRDANAFNRLLRKELDPSQTAGSPYARIRVAETEVPESASYPKASSLHAPVTEVDPKQGEVLRQLADELLPQSAPLQRAAGA